MATHSSILAWRIPVMEATIYGVAQSQTQLKRISSSSSKKSSWICNSLSPFILDTRLYFFPNISYYPEVYRSILGSSLIVCKLQAHISRYTHVSILCSKLSLTNKNFNELILKNLLRYFLNNIDSFAHVCLEGGMLLIVFQQQQKHSLHGSSLSRECLPL